MTDDSNSSPMREKRLWHSPWWTGPGLAVALPLISHASGSLYGYFAAYRVDFPGTVICVLAIGAAVYSLYCLCQCRSWPVAAMTAAAGAVIAVGVAAQVVWKNAQQDLRHLPPVDSAGVSGGRAVPSLPGVVPQWSFFDTSPGDLPAEAVVLRWLALTAGGDVKKTGWIWAGQAVLLTVVMIVAAVLGSLRAREQGHPAFGRVMAWRPAFASGDGVDAAIAAQRARQAVLDNADSLEQAERLMAYLDRIAPAIHMAGTVMGEALLCRQAPLSETRARLERLRWVDLALQEGRLALLEEILTQGIDLNRCDPGEDPPLIKAVRLRRVDMGKMLVRYGAAVDVRGVGGVTALAVAAEQGDVAMCQWLITERADVNAVDDAGRTVLMKAAASGNDVLVKLLLSCGAVPDQEGEADLTAPGPAQVVQPRGTAVDKGVERSVEDPCDEMCERS